MVACWVCNHVLHHVVAWKTCCAQYCNEPSVQSVATTRRYIYLTEAICARLVHGELQMGGQQAAPGGHVTQYTNTTRAGTYCRPLGKKTFNATKAIN